MPEQVIYLCKSAFFLCIYTQFLLRSLALSQIPLGSRLTVDEYKSWLSSNGDFAFRFFSRSDLPKQYSIGIRFNSKSIPEEKQTVLWVAGADVSVGKNSYFELNKNGELVLFDVSKGVPVWTSKTSQLSVFSASLQDNGNLVLVNENKDVVWQSFDTPSDTLLPGQNLTVYKTLRATSKSTVSSYYTLFMNASGQLQLRWESDVIYWSSGNFFPGSNLTALLTSDGAFQLLDQGFKPVWSIYGEDHNEHEIRFRFLRLDFDGNLRLYSWIQDSLSWRSVWRAVENPCNVFATCGQNGICALNQSGSSYCDCPFQLVTESSSRCLAPYRKDCKSDSNMLRYEHTYLYGIYPPNDPVFETSLQDCQALCLTRPLCTASTYTNDGTRRCFIKETPYITGYFDPSQNSISFVRKCSDPVAVDPKFNHPLLTPTQSQTKEDESYGFCFPCLFGASLGTLLIFIIVQFGVGFFIYRRRNSIRKKALLAYTGPNSKGLIMLSFSEIEILTENFKHQIGSNMFKGILQNNHPILVKDLKVTIEERKFRGIVSKIGTIHHRNLVKLEGYCCESSHRFIIYEHVKNGSVEKHLQDSKLCKRVTWKRRMEICVSVARAICYLHNECREFLNHGNLKLENVVLDENLEAKVIEFGLGSIYGELDSFSSWAEKDVEDFGKVVLMVITGCLETEDLCEWAYKEWVEGQAENVVDKRIIEGGFDSNELERALRIAFWCVQVDHRLKPSMGEVVKVLEGVLNVDPPPPPFACRRLVEEVQEVEELEA